MSEPGKVVPRGIRNNNPLNLRRGTYWQGLCATQTDPDFCQFQTMVFGVRAAFRCLRTYIVNRKLNTIRLILERWAPSSENDTELYIAKVVEWTGIPSNRVISFFDKEDMFSLFNAMCKMETGQRILPVTVANGYALV